MNTPTVLLIVHGLLAVALLGAITHQAVSVWAPARRPAGSFVGLYRSVPAPSYANAIVVLYVLTFVLGGFVYAFYRIEVRLVVEQLGQSPLTLDGVAEALAVSRRTLTRRLAEERTSFRQILDDVRRDFARALLRDRSLSIGDIAFFLQYSEPAAFHRSFRRWTGKTPQAFREA